MICLRFGFDCGAECGQALADAADVVQSLNSCLLDPRLRVGDQVVDEAVEDAFQGFVEFQLVGGVGIDLLDFAEKCSKDWDAFADLLEREQMGFVAVVKVGGVVGDFVGQVDELGFERRALVEQIFGEFRMLVAS